MTTKILTFILTLSFILKIIFWLFTDYPISRSSMLVIGLLILILNVKTKLVWSFGLLFFACVIASIFLNLNISPANAYGSNPFLFLDSILHSLHLRTNKTWNILLGIFPLLLYIFLLVVFLTPKFRRKYFAEKNSS